MKPMTEAIRQKIADYRKNRLDISELIKDVDLKEADLSYCVITHIERVQADLSKINFAHATIGCEDKISKFLNCRMIGANFDSCIFAGKAWVRGCDVRNGTLRNGDFSKVSYQHSDFRGTSFCQAIFRIGTIEAVGAKFDIDFFKNLCAGSDYEVILRPKGIQ